MFIDDIKSIEQKFLTNVAGQHKLCFENGKLRRNREYHTQHVVGEEFDLKTLKSMENIIVDSQDIYISKLFTSGLEQDAIRYEKNFI